MKNYLSNIITLLIEKESNDNLEYRLANGIYTLSMLCCFSMAIAFTNILTTAFISALYFVGILSGIGYYFTRIRKLYNPAMLIMVCIDMCITFFDWKENGGIKGTVTLTYAMLLVINVHMIQKKYYVHLAIGTFMYLFFLVSLESYLPELVNHGKRPIIAAAVHWFFMILMIFYILVLFKDQDIKIKNRLLNKEGELLNALQNEKEHNLLKNKFISMVSHQFRTPMTVIHSSTELIEFYASSQLTGEKPKIEKQFYRIYDSIDRIKIMMEKVLAFGMLESDKINYKPSIQDLLDFLEHLIAEYPSERGIEKKALKVKGKPRLLSYDRNLIDHSVSNLIANAIKYDPKHRFPEIEAHFKEEYVEITVKDRGIGIPLGEQEKLYQPFFRASNAENLKGTGVGLALVKQFIELHNGEIVVESELNKGSRFSICLPYRSVEFKED